MKIMGMYNISLAQCNPKDAYFYSYRPDRKTLPMLWIFFTVFAAFMQAWRNAFQSQLAQSTKTLGVTLARFLWAGPFAALYLGALYALKPTFMPDPDMAFTPFILGAALMQIIATSLMVKVFQHHNYAVGVGLAKSEAMIAAILGVGFFGTSLSFLGLIGVLIGSVAVFMMSTKGKWRQLNRTTILLGLASGTSFALTSLWVREASKHVGLPFPHSAAWVLFCVISIQTIVLLCYLSITDRQTLRDLWRHPKLSLLISLFSCLGSIGWFSAMSLQSVPYVKTVGQIEVIFTIWVNYWLFKTKLRSNEFWGLLLIALSAILVMWA